MRRLFPASLHEWQRLPGMWQWSTLPIGLSSLNVSLNGLAHATVCVIPSDRPFVSVGFAGDTPGQAHPVLQHTDDHLSLMTPPLSLVTRFKAASSPSIDGLRCFIILSHWPASTTLDVDIGSLWLLGDAQPHVLADEKGQGMVETESEFERETMRARALVQAAEDGLPGDTTRGEGGGEAEGTSAEPTRSRSLVISQADVRARVRKGELCLSNVFTRDINASNFIGDVLLQWDVPQMLGHPPVPSPPILSPNHPLVTAEATTLWGKRTLAVRPPALSEEQDTSAPGAFPWLSSSRPIQQSLTTLHHRWLQGHAPLWDD